MDETKWKAVPVEPTDEMSKAYGDALNKLDNEGHMGLTLSHHVERSKKKCRYRYSAMLAAAPTTHVAVKRELLKRTEELLGQALKHLCDHENELPVSYEVLAELRALLSQKGE